LSGENGLSTLTLGHIGRKFYDLEGPSVEAKDRVIGSLQPDLTTIFANPLILCGLKVAAIEARPEYSVAEAIGRGSDMLNGPATDGLLMAELYRAARSGDRAEGYIIRYRKDGSEFPSRLVIEPIDDDNGTRIAYMGTMSDVTDEAKHKATVQRQKMESLGGMIGGVAHEVNNMLSPVMLLSQHLMDKDLVTPAGQPLLKIILESAGNARNIIAHLLQFSRSKSASPELHDPATLLNDGMEIVTRAVPASTALEVHIEGQPPPIAFDKTAFSNSAQSGFQRIRRDLRGRLCESGSRLPRPRKRAQALRPFARVG